MTALEIPPSRAAELEQLAESAREYIGRARAPRTVEAYRDDWRDFQRWAERMGHQAMPAAPESVALYITGLAGVKAVATIQRRLTSISVAHQMAGHESPTRTAAVRETWKGIKRTFGTAQQGKAPARTQEIRRMVATLDATVSGDRDRALLLVGFAGALRRSELVALDVADIAWPEEGLVVTIRHSKTDQEGAGAQLGIPFGADEATCPVRALRRWLEVSEITEGPLFRKVERNGVVSGNRMHPTSVALVVKRAARAAGYDEAKFAGHSLRAGFITSAAENDVPERKIMRQSRHQSIPVMRRYIRGATLFKDNAAASVGL